MKIPPGTPLRRIPSDVSLPSGDLRTLDLKLKTIMRILPDTPLEEITGYLPLPVEHPEHILEEKVDEQLRRVNLQPSTSTRGFTRIPALAYTNVDHGYDVLDIPTEWNTSQHLEFCGLRPDVAQRLVAGWEERRRASQEEDGWLQGTAVDECLVDCALDEIRTPRYDELHARGDWDGALDELGLAKDVIRAIMDPRHEKIRELGDPLHWATDTIAMNHDFLIDLNKRIRSRKSYLQQLRRRRDDTRRPDEAPPREDSDDSKVYFLPLPAHAAWKLYWNTHRRKGVDGARPGFILPATGSELHPTAQHHIHLLQDKSLAVEMASYTAARCRSREAAILHVPVPRAYIAQARKEDPVSPEEWRRLVWLSRNRKIRGIFRGNLPRSLRVHAERLFLEVPVCGLVEERVTALESYRDIRPLRLEDGTDAVQLVLVDEDVRGELWSGFVNDDAVPEWISDVASGISQTFIKREDIEDDEWDEMKWDCWNSWRWNLWNRWNRRRRSSC